MLCPPVNECCCKRIIKKGTVIFHRYKNCFAICMACAFNNSVQASIATSFIIHNYPIDGIWDIVAPME